MAKPASYAPRWVAILFIVLAFAVGKLVSDFQKDNDDDFDWTQLPPWPVFKLGLMFSNLLPYLQSKLLPPPIHTLMVVSAFMHSKTLYTAVFLGIPDILGANGPLHIDELAAQTGANPERLNRVLTDLQGLGFFKQTAKKTWANNRNSGVLRANHPASMRAMVLHWGYESYIGHMYMDQGVKKDETRAAFEIYSGGLKFWEWLDKEGNENLNENFDKAMVSGAAISTRALLSDYNWKQYAGKTVADVGGGVGSFLAELLKAQPDINGILFDRSTVIPHAEKYWQENYPDLLPRVQFVTGSFFESVPVADVYFMRLIIHDWNHTESARILKTVRAAAKDDSVLLIGDMVLPDKPPPMMTMLDLQMMVMIDGKERAVDEWQQVLADGGWKHEKVVPLRSIMSLTVAKPA